MKEMINEKKWQLHFHRIYGLKIGATMARAIIKEINSVKEECALSDDDLDTVEELRDLMEDTVEGNYKPDSLTTQPINIFIAKQKAIKRKK